MNNLTKKLVAIMIALVVSGSLSAQTPRNGNAPKPMDVSAFQNSIVKKEKPAPKQNRDFVTMLEEDFSLMTAGSEAEPDQTNLVDMSTYYIDPNYTHEPGWMGAYIYQAGGMCAVGQSYIAFINTPEFEMAGSVHISFRARIQSGNQCQTIVGLCIDPANPQIIDFDGMYMTSEWQTYEFDFSNPESLDAFIQINCYTPWLLDDLVVSRELDFTPAPNALPATHYTMEGFDANWNEVNTAEDYLLTVFKRNFYGPEQVYVAPESFEDINNDGQFIDWTNPNLPEGWGINIQAGSNREVTTDAYDGNLALCMDAVGDTLILPSNGGRYLESNVWIRLLEYNPDNDNTELQFIAKIDGNWQYIGVYIPDWNVYSNHGMEWDDTNLFSLWIDDKYDEFGLAYVGEGSTVWAIDYWDYTTSQACDIEIVYEDLEIAAPGLTYTVTGLNPAEDHYYYVKARNTEYGESAPSNHISCFGLCAPIIKGATEIGDGCYTANWEAHPKADAYEVHNYAMFTAEANTTNAIVFAEEFAQVTNGLEPQNYMIDEDPFKHRLDEYTEFKDWNGTGVIVAEQMVGAADNEYYYGQITTPELKLDNAETYHVKTTIWGYEGETISIKALTTGEEHTFDYAETGFQTLEMDFTAGPESGRERLKFMDKYGYPFLIDELQITQDLQAGDQYFGMLEWNRIEDGTAESHTYTGLNGYGWEHFAYDVMGFHYAFGDEYASVNSEQSLAEVPLSVDELDGQEFTVYPNPANEKVSLSVEAEHVSVYDTKGALVLSLRNVSEVNTSMLPDGLYLMKVRNVSGHVFAKEIVVKH